MGQFTYQESAMQHLILSRVEDLVREFTGNQAIILLQGLTTLQANAAMRSPYAVMAPDSLFDSRGYLDLDKVNQNKGMLFAQLYSSSEPVVLLYEQALPIRQALGDLFSGTVVLVENNLFPSSAPIPTAVDKKVLSDFSASIDSALSEKSSAVDEFYGEIIPCGKEWLVTPIPLDSGEIDVITRELFSSSSFSIIDQLSQVSTQPVNENILTELAINACLGIASDSALQFDVAEGLSDVQKEQLEALAAVHAALGVTLEVYSSRQAEAFDTGDILLPTLRCYWGERADYRSLRIYENPSVDNKMREVSQGEIAGFAVSQAEAALRESQDYHDLFVTAPTGAGKSLLFQLPALYLAEKHHVLTLVIEPLKALMEDQVDSLKKRGVHNVVAINSDHSYEERLHALESIQNGTTSIVYLSPELLLASSPEELFPNRRIGLVVIDEVHTVSSWGRDFRPDYWYLGPYLSRLRKRGYSFPVFCMTATAVYGGKDDAVRHTIKDLDLFSPHLWLGNPRRDDIAFNIRRVPKSQYAGRIDEVKVELAVKAAQQFVDNNSHSIIYCPYRSHVNEVTEAAIAQFPGSSKVLGFHGGMENSYKQFVRKEFTQRSCLVLISTKAFGMGIDVDDITDVYHYAPTGNLSDYVQEIGRGARKKTLTATASIDFFGSDASYAKRLYALSRFHDWQLRDIMEKLYQMYSARPRDRRTPNLLVSPDSFSYLFPDENDDSRKVSRTKSALMMIAKDLEDRYNFPVVIVRPRPSFTKCFICISREIGQQFIDRYGKYITRLSESKISVEHHKGQQDVRVTDIGDIYELQAANMWEECFPNFTFADFKRRLFKGELLPFDNSDGISPRIRLEISYKNEYEKVRALFEAYARALGETFRQLARQTQFESKEFVRVFSEKLGRDVPALDHPGLLLESFIRPVDNTSFGKTCSDMKFVKKLSSTKQVGAFSVANYRIKYSAVMDFEEQLMRRFDNIKPNWQNQYRRYINRHNANKIYETAELLEVLQLASYESHGGDEPEIFIRLNDPSKLHQLATNEKFKNRVLRETTARHNYSSEVIASFFRTDLEDSKRWDLIEEYFLGNDGVVAKALGLPVDEGDSLEPKVRYRGERELFTGPSLQVIERGAKHEGSMFHLWNRLVNACSSSTEVNSCRYLKEKLKSSAIERPYQDALLLLEGSEDPIKPLLYWQSSKVLLFGHDQEDDFSRASCSNWNCYMLGAENLEALVEQVYQGSHSERGENLSTEAINHDISNGRLA